MASKRMFSIEMVSSDAFLELPISAQCLYFHLCLRADDDGFMDSPKKACRECQANIKDLELLKQKRYILAFESGVVLIKHWFMHNTIPKDRYHETRYLEEKSLVQFKENKSYTECEHVEYNSDTEIRLDKIILDKIRKDKKNFPTETKKRCGFVPPQIEEVKAYCDSVGSKIDPEAFVAFYDSKGWVIGKTVMKSWKAAIVTWEKRNGLCRVKPCSEKKIVKDSNEPGINLWDGEDDA